MRTLQVTSAIAAACSVLMWCFLLVQPVLPMNPSAATDAGFIILAGGMLIGLLAAFIGLVAGATLGPHPAWRIRILTGSHALTIVLTGVVVLWAFVFPQSGWELLALPGGVMIGQLPAICVLTAYLWTRSSPRQDRPIG
ncbi:hypothetical protein [Tomitella fengzijianii]|uniref:Uncharacterized protein n=1 Tax=Tomitella fengzijianii TaxID=2597660 RepID=A0A516X6K2_9ACTN|nr:hypothetical protein [Tomitella fengzijianii]QDQ98685.1 hypothetical protein FO059_16825 [Tomitella fengzijianii]